MNGIKSGCIFVSMLMFLALLMNWHIVFHPLSIVYYLQAVSGFALLLVVGGLLFLLVNLLAAVGMYRMQWWGFVMTYTAIVFSSIFYAVCYVPYFDRLFPIKYTSLSLLAANVSVLFAVIYLQVMSRVRPPRARAIREKKVVQKKVIEKKPVRKAKK